MFDFELVKDTYIHLKSYFTELKRFNFYILFVFSFLLISNLFPIFVAPHLLFYFIDCSSFLDFSFDVLSSDLNLMPLAIFIVTSLSGFYLFLITFFEVHVTNSIYNFLFSFRRKLIVTLNIFSLYLILAFVILILGLTLFIAYLILFIILYNFGLPMLSIKVFVIWLVWFCLSVFIVLCSLVVDYFIPLYMETNSFKIGYSAFKEQLSEYKNAIFTYSIMKYLCFMIVIFICSFFYYNICFPLLYKIKPEVISSLFYFNSTIINVKDLLINIINLIISVLIPMLLYLPFTSYGYLFHRIMLKHVFWKEAEE